MRIGRCISVALWIVSLFQFFALQSVVAEPRAPYPPWPQEKLATFGWDSPFWPLPVAVPVAIGEDSALLAESWSGYALVRDNLTTAGPVVIPVAGNGKEPNVASGHGAIRFWISPNWSTVGEQNEGKGPGQYARLLEMGNWSGKVAETWWSLYVNETGDTIYFSGQGKGGAVDYLKAPVEFRAGDWRMVTVCYSPTNTALWLDDQLLATGAGMAAPPTWVEQNWGLVVGSDVTASSGSSAEAQFEELTTFDYWPGADAQKLYHHAVSRQAALGTVGTAAEEQVKLAALKAAAGVAMEKTGGGSYGLLDAYSYASNTLWLEITGVTNGLAYLIVHGTVEDVGCEILSQVTLTNVPWVSEGTILGAVGQDWTPTTVLVGDRTNTLFFWARSLVDSDGSGLPDWWQLQNFGHTGVDPYGDPDGDGWNNLQEYQNGSNPNSFNTPPKPAGFTAGLIASGQQVLLAWSPSSGNVTGYAIERDTGTGFQVVATVAPSNLYYTNSFVVTNDMTHYRIKALYGTAESGYSDQENPVIQSSYTAEAFIVRGPQGRYFLVSSYLPPQVTSLRLFRHVFSLHYPLTPEANFLWEDEHLFTPALTNGSIDISVSSLTNGVYEIPSNFLPLYGGCWFEIQAFAGDGKKGATTMASISRADAADPYSQAFRAIPSLDGREQIRDNAEFLLRAGTGMDDYGYDQPLNIRISRLIWAYDLGHHDYVSVGFHYIGNLGKLVLDEFRPYEQNYLLANFAFATNNVTASGDLKTGPYPDWIWGDIELFFNVHNPSNVFSTYGFALNPPTNGVASLLTTNTTRWIFLSYDGLYYFGYSGFFVASSENKLRPLS